MKIKSITISGMHNVTTPKTYNFKNINYLIGKNGSGKSTVLQAIQLAILGYIPGTDKRVSEIFTHSSSKSMSVDLRLTNDEIVTESSSECLRILRTWSVKGRSVQSNIATEPKDFELSTLVNEIELPIFNFNEFLGLSRNQLKSWFLNFLPKPDCKIDWKREFTKTLLDATFILSDERYLDEVIEEAVESDEGLEAVQQTNTNLKELLSAKKIEVARLEGAVQALIFYDDVSTEDYEESKAEIMKQLAELKYRQNTAREVKTIIRNNESIASKIASCNAKLLTEEQIEKDKAAVAEVAEKEAELAAARNKYETELNDLQTQITSLEVEISRAKAIIEKDGICPYTQSSCLSIKEYIAELKQSVAEKEKTLEEAYSEKEACRKHIVEKHHEREVLNRDYNDANSRLGNNTFIEKQIEDYRAQLTPVTAEQLELANTSIEELEAKEAELQDKLSKLEANRQYEEKINSITANKFKAENELEALKLLIKRTDANNMQTEIAAMPFAEFTNKMDEIVPELFGREVSFHINLESKANSFSFGIAKYPVGSDEIYIPYHLMSSGEKTLLAFAMMSYIAQNSSSALKLVMIDDMLDHLDDANIASLFNKFADANIQIINAGVKSVDNPEINIIQI